MFCKECGHENRNDRKFCSECGKPLEDYTKPKENLVMPDEVQKEKEAIKTKNTSKIFNTISECLFILGVILTVVSFFFDGITVIILDVAAFVFYLTAAILIIVKKKVLKKQDNKKE